MKKLTNRKLKRLLSQQIQKLESMSYQLLVKKVNSVETSIATTEDGIQVQIEISYLWDHKEGEDIRIIVSGDTGGLMSFFPLSLGALIRRAE